MGAMNVKAHEATRTNIMVKCFECYAEHGLGSVGIKRLAEECGISSGNLYFYFENRASVHYALFEEEYLC